MTLSPSFFSAFASKYLTSSTTWMEPRASVSPSPCSSSKTLLASSSGSYLLFSDTSLSTMQTSQSASTLKPLGALQLRSSWQWSPSTQPLRTASGSAAWPSVTFLTWFGARTTCLRKNWPGSGGGIKYCSSGAPAPPSQLRQSPRTTSATASLPSSAA